MPEVTVYLANSMVMHLVADRAIVWRAGSLCFYDGMTEVAFFTAGAWLYYVWEEPKR